MRQKRRIGEGPLAWQRWSSTIEELERLIGRIVARPAPNIDILALKFRAILLMMENNESLLDLGDRRRLRRFGRDLAALVHGRSR